MQGAMTDTHPRSLGFGAYQSRRLAFGHAWRCQHYHLPLLLKPPSVSRAASVPWLLPSMGAMCSPPGH